MQSRLSGWVNDRRRSSALRASSKEGVRVQQLHRDQQSLSSSHKNAMLHTDCLSVIAMLTLVCDILANETQDFKGLWRAALSSLCVLMAIGIIYNECSPSSKLFDRHVLLQPRRGMTGFQGAKLCCRIILNCVHVPPGCIEESHTQLDGTFFLFRAVGLLLWIATVLHYHR